jgi:hypothetical protein
MHNQFSMQEILKNKLKRTLVGAGHSLSSKTTISKTVTNIRCRRLYGDGQQCRVTQLEPETRIENENL